MLVSQTTKERYENEPVKSTSGDGARLDGQSVGLRAWCEGSDVRPAGGPGEVIASIGDVVGDPMHDDAPAHARIGIVLVDLEGHLRPGCIGQLRPRRGTEHDRTGSQRVGDWKEFLASLHHECDSAEGVPREHLKALWLLDYLQLG